MRAIGIALMLLISCVAAAQERPDAWYPRTEKPASDEMFVVALGTGMPTPITRAQKSTAWYVELGNGDIFLFDVGSGSMESFFALRPELTGWTRFLPVTSTLTMLVTLLRSGSAVG
jgi:hypothetical protein